MAEKKPKETKKSAAPPDNNIEAAPVKEASEPGKKGSKLKLIIIIVAAMVVGGAAAFGAMRFFFSAPTTETEEVSGFSEPPHPAPEEPASDSEPIVAPTKDKESSSGSGHGGAPAAEAGAEGAAVLEGPITIELKPFTTNLNEPSGRRFLKVSIGLEVENQQAANEVNKMMPDIQDKILILLSSQSTEDISNVDGKERLRSQILNRINNLLTEHKVKKVKYSEFIIQ